MALKVLEKFLNLTLSLCQPQCIVPPNLLGGHFNAGIYNRCFGFQSIIYVIYYYHPMVILAHFNFFILKLQLFVTSEGKM
jgi:hypothetical protein